MSGSAARPLFSPEQLATLCALGEEHEAAVGDVRAGSIKRCATAVGEGAMAVRFVHERTTGVPA